MRLFILVSFILLIVSCNETELKIDLPAPKPKLVVQSTFTPFTPPKVKSFSVFVNQNAGVFDSFRIDPIPDATVSLFIDGKFDQILQYDSVIGYCANFFPKAGIEYSISVEKQGFEMVTAIGMIPKKVPIKNSELIPFAGLDEGKLAFSQLSVTFEDPANQTNYYEIMVLGYQDENDIYMLSTNDKVITSESYYPSPILLDANRPRRLLFNDKQINGQTHTVEMTYSPPQSGNIDKHYISYHQIFLSFRSVSEVYYLYYTTLFKHFNDRRADMLFGIAEPGHVYTNIQNGYGVFAGYYEDNRTFEVDSLRVR